MDEIPAWAVGMIITLLSFMASICGALLWWLHQRLWKNLDNLWLEVRKVDSDADARLDKLEATAITDKTLYREIDRKNKNS